MLAGPGFCLVVMPLQSEPKTMFGIGPSVDPGAGLANPTMDGNAWTVARRQPENRARPCTTVGREISRAPLS